MYLLGINILGGVDTVQDTIYISVWAKWKIELPPKGYQVVWIMFICDIYVEWMQNKPADTLNKS